MKNFKIPNKLMASILCANMILMNVPLKVLSSEISGFNQASGTYNIDATRVSGNTGFRNYEKFNLSQGDIANLLFSKGGQNYEHFVNLVNSRVNIDGIVNTMRGTGFYNGHAVFVSPQGILVGASGVLNVGSLSVLTPSQGKFDSFYNTVKNGSDSALANYIYNSDKYKDLITDSSGNVVVNGKILARKDVNLYGKNVSVGNGTDRAGIVAGWNDSTTTFDSNAAFESTFNSLVSNNIQNPDGFSLVDGKINIVANHNDDSNAERLVSIDFKKSDLGANDVNLSSTVKVDMQNRIDKAEAKINIEDSNITGSKVAIKAKSEQNKKDNFSSGEDILNSVTSVFDDIFSENSPSLTSLWGAAGEAVASVTVKDSILTAVRTGDKDGLSVAAEAASSTTYNANLLTPAIIDLLKPESEAKWSEFFSTGIYNGFEGPRSSATVTIDHSTLKANKAIDISTEASSSYDVNNRLLAFVMPVGLYGTGTKTVSKAIVKNGSTLTSKDDDVSVTAVSTNENGVNLTNSSTASFLLADDFIGVILNNNNVTDTEASITGSTVDANNLNLLATNLLKTEAEMGFGATSGKKTSEDSDRGSSAASVAALLNRTDNSVKAIVDSSTVTTEENTSVIAQSLNTVKNTVDVDISNDMSNPNRKAFGGEFTEKFKEKTEDKLNKNLFDKIFHDYGDEKPTVNPAAQAGGVLVWNETKNNTVAKITNDSTVTAGKDVTVQADTIDLTVNRATSSVPKSGNWGVGLAVIYNNQNNTTNAEVNGSTITANNLTVDSLTELPMNQGSLTFGLNLPFKIFGVEKVQFGGKFASEANGKWDVSGVYPKPQKEEGESDFEITGLAEQNLVDSLEGLKPKVRLSGFFNNYAQTSAGGSNAAISGSVIYNNVVNNTTSDIVNGSNITVNNNGNLIVNAANSVIGYNAGGMVDFLIKQINYKIPMQEDKQYKPEVAAGTFGLGANFLWDNYTNNATAKIDGSSVVATGGTVNVDSATEQSYMTIIMTGGKSEKFGIDGSAHYQNLKGTTLASVANVKDDNKIIAKDVNINAGKTKIKTTGGKISRDDDSNLLKWKVQDESASGDEKYIRDAKDTISNIIAQGAWTSQYQEVENTVQTSSFGVAAGASVNVTDIDRTVKAEINNAIVNATGDTFVVADSYDQKIDVEVAAAFSGGVKQKKAGNASNNAQDRQDADDENIFGNLFDHEDEYMKNPVGNALTAVQGQFSMSIAGAVDVTNDKTKVEAAITNNSEVNTGNKLEVKANNESKNIVFSGGLGKSKKVGAGAAVNVYMQDGYVKSYIDDSTVTFSGAAPELNILANNKNWLLDIAIGAGVASNDAEQDKGFQAAVGGSASINTLKPTIESYINASTVKMAEGKTGNIKTTLNAMNDVDIIDVAGGGSYMKGGSSGLSAGAAFNYNNIKNTISTYIKNSTLENIGKLAMLANADNDFNSVAIAASIVSGVDGGAFSFAGSADVDYIHDTVSSKVIGSTITASDDIDISANSSSKNLNVAGTMDYTSAKSGAGVNGDVAVNVYRNNITSEIDNASKILKAKDVRVVAGSTEKSNVIPVGAAVATGSQFLMAAANVGVNVIDNAVSSIVSGHIGSGEGATKVNSVSVNAYDETTLYSRGGTLSIASADSIANLAASVNVDKIDKTVEAKITGADIKATGEVAVKANSINSLGGTKEDGEYKRNDVTTDTYKDSMLRKNDKGEYDDLKLGNDFENWNMFYNISAGANVSVGGAGIGKVIENTVTAEINNSEIEADNLTVKAKDYSVKNIIAGSIGASSKAAAGLQALYTRDNSTTSALVSNGSKLNITNILELDAENRKDSYEILVAGSGAGKGVINANVVLNNITDKTYAKIDNSSTEKEITAGTIKLNADEDINSSHIVVTAGGAANLALSVSPTINTYNMTTESVISNANVKNAAINMDSQSMLGTLDISVGVAGVGQGVAGTGIAIKNNYNNTVKSYIDSAIIDTTKDISLDANSIIKSNNWIASVSVAGQGVSVVTNVLLNNVTSVLEAGIKNSTITNAGTITINTNKDKKDDISNKAIGLGVVGEGASALVNVVQNIYKNTITSYIDNTVSTAINSVSINSNSNRKLNNINFGVSVAGVGASLLANALVNQIDSTTISKIDAKDKTLNITNALNIDVKDSTSTDNTMAMINGAGLGAAVGANINLYYANNIAKAEVLSASGGQINAGSSNINSHMVNALDNTNVSVSLGAGAIAADVALIKLGKRSDTYSDSEQKSKITDAVDFTKNKYDDFNSKLKDGYYIERDSEDNVKYYTIENNTKVYHSKADSIEQVGPSLYTPTSSPSDIKTGAISSVNGNLKTTNNVAIKAESVLKGLGSNDKLSLTNTNVSAGLATVGVAVKNTQLANNTLAEIAGGTVISEEGNIGIDAESKSNVDIKNVKVDISGITVSGGSAIYNNTSETTAKISNATVKTKGDLSVNSKSTSNSTIDSTNVVVTGGNIVAVDLAENKDTNKSIAMISGNTNITSEGALNVHSTVNTDLKSTKATVTVAGASIVSVSKNEVDAHTISKAILENVNGTISSNGLNIITDYGKLSAYTKSNVTSVKLGDVASVDSSGSFMTAEFTTGVNSLEGLTLSNSGETRIEAAKEIVQSGESEKGVIAESEINNVHVSLQGFVASTSAKAENKATSTTYLKAKKHDAKSLDINSNLKSTAKATAGATKATIGIGVNTVSINAKDTSTLNVEVDGENSISSNELDSTKINANHVSDVKADLSAFNFGGLIGGGQRIRITSDETANTTGTIGGKFNVNSASVNFNTLRNSILSMSSGSGSGIVNVNDTGVTNTLTGASTLNIEGFNPNAKDKLNNWTISNKSTNTFDVTTSNGSGGFINVATGSKTLTFNTSTTTNVLNSQINSTGAVNFNVENNGIVNDQATSGGGGFVAVSSNTVNNTYSSGANLLIKDSDIKVKDLGLKTSSDIRTSNTRNDGYIYYAGTSGGFVAVENMNLTNTLNQTSAISIQNSKLEATNNVNIKSSTSSSFKQRIETNGRGFVSVPKANSTLDVTNNNTLSVDSTSKILAGNELDISFDSNDTLGVYTASDARNFAGVPSAYSTLKFKVNNILTDNGSLEAGNLVDINFMNNSTSNLTQYAYSECHAAVASTREGGALERTIKNAINVAANADITSGKDIEISYSSGNVNRSSTVAWKTVSYAFLGIPISDSDSYPVDKPTNAYTLTDDGKIVAGQGNSRYMMIDREGNVDSKTLKGFYDDDYILVDGEAISGEVIKSNNLASIQIELKNVRDSLQEAEDTIIDMQTVIEAIESEEAVIGGKLTELKDLINDGAILTQDKADENGDSAFNTLIQNDIKAAVVKTSDEDPDKDKKITQTEYDKITNDYIAKLDEISIYNNGHFEKKSEPTIFEFISKDEYGLTDAQLFNIDAYFGKDNASENIVGTGFNQISQEKYDTITAAYNTQKATQENLTILEFLSKYDLSDKQIRNIQENYNTDNSMSIIGSGDNQISQANFDTISNAYTAKLEEINIYNYGHEVPIEEPTMKDFITANNSEYNLTPEQIDNMSSGYDSVYGNIVYTEKGGFAVYTRADGKYVAVDNPTGSGTDQTCDEITQFNTSIANLKDQKQPYVDKKAANLESKNLLLVKEQELVDEYNVVYNTDAKEYEKRNETYSIIFNDLNPKSAHISVNGANNSSITGNGIFSVATNGLKVDNYSTRSLIFNDLNIDSATAKSGLIIGGKEHSVFAGKDQAVSGLDAYMFINGVSGHKDFDNLPTSGVHYKNGEDNIAGITINNYYDINHPFADSSQPPFNIKNPTLRSEVIFTGDIYTTNPLNVWNESGGILFVTDTITTGKTTLAATNSTVAYYLQNATNNTKMVLKSGDSIFAASGVNIIANEVDIKGNIKTGYSSRSLTITDDMLLPENLIIDPTSGEKNLINLGGNPSPYLNVTNNIKAIYKDGQIYLYKIPEIPTELGVLIEAMTSLYEDTVPSSGSITGSIDISQGYQNIDIKNNTDKPLNIFDVDNVKFGNNLKADGVDITGATVNYNNQLYATTKIESTGRLSLNSEIKNNLHRIIGHDYVTYAPNANLNGKLDIIAKNGLDIKKLTAADDSELNSILAGGDVNITTKAGVINIDGNITDTGNINIKNEGSGDLNINGDVIQLQGNINVDSAAKTTITGSLANAKGNIAVISKDLSITDTAEILDKEGDISITNSSGNMLIAGYVQDNGGNILFANSGDSAAISGDIIDEKGDLTFINNKGNMTILSSIYHNYLNQSSNGMITIRNTSGAGVMDIQSAIASYGAGKIVDSNLLAVLIENQSTTKGISVTNGVTARLGNIVISNTTDDLKVAGLISNYEQGNIKISNSGKNLQSTAQIINKKGNVAIANLVAAENVETSSTLIGGSINNQDGSVSISSNGNFLEQSGIVENSNGDILYTNSNGQVRFVGDVTNRGGNITITNNGNYTEIASNITNEILSVTDEFDVTTNKSGSIQISNAEGNFRILENAVISNTTDDAEKGILIANTSDAGQFIMQGTINSFNKGYISVLNNGDAANISGDIFAKDGSIGITNSGDGKLAMSGNVINYKGDVRIYNNSDAGAEIGGTITDEQGDIEISNNGSGSDANLKITSQITHNYIKNASPGMITITNSATAGQVEIDSIISTDGAGKVDTDGNVTAILIDNKSTDYGMSISNGLSARVGDIIIKNANKDLSTSGLISNYEEGNVVITNAGKDYTNTASIINKKGNVTISNTNSEYGGKLQLGGSIVNQDGNTTVSNSGTNLVYSGTITNNGGNTSISNANGLTHVYGDITNTGGDTTITNSGSFTEITSAIENEAGSIHISNSNGHLNIGENARIKNTSDNSTHSITISNDGDNLYIAGGINGINKGDIEITNTGSGTAIISGGITAKEGNIDVSNSALSDKLTISGDISDDKGTVSITNNGANGTEISGNIADKEGAITVSNTAGTLDITGTGKITDDKGNISISNTATDKGTTLAGQVLAKEGNIAVGNAGDKLTVSGDVSDDNGDVTITNSGVTGTEISGNIADKEGAITVSNTAGTLNITGTGKISDDKGNISISNTATDKGTTLAGQVLAKEGNIAVGNAGDKLTVSGDISDDQGNINIANSGNNGIEFTSTAKVTDAIGDTTISNNNGDLTVANGAEIKNTESGNITTENNGDKFTIAGLIKHIGDAIGNIFVRNSGDNELEVATTGRVETSNGNIDIQNSNTGALNIAGTVASDKGTTTVNNTSNDGIMITTTGKIHNGDGNVSISNTGTTGIDVHGSVKADKQDIIVTNYDSDLRIGEYASTNDNYINAVTGNVTLNQTNGNIINNITDPDISAKHQNYDLANPNQSYKTLIATGNNLIINATDGNIGSTTNANPGFSIDAGTRDYTESVNVNVGGNVVAKALNQNNTDKRLVNIRAKDSNLNIENVTSDGSIILTAADWKQADTRPTPNDENYFKGYSILNAANMDNPTVTGQNISVISSNSIGTSDNKFVYMQDTLNNPNSSVSIEAENDLNITGKANSDNIANIYQIISKHGSIDLDLESDNVIRAITSNKALNITQKAQNLTIIDLGLPVSTQGSTTQFDDMLFPHDDLVYGVDPASSQKSVVPSYINIKALDAMKNPDRADSTIKIYNAYVRGNHGENTQYYPNGTRLADVTLMADNIYANSAKAPDSTVSTVANPNGYKQQDNYYRLSDFGFSAGVSTDVNAVLEAHGINAYGDGEPLSLDILGVDKDIVDKLVSNPNRSIYDEQQSVNTTPSIFINNNDEIPYYNTDYRANNAVISVNDYVDTNRGVIFDTLYSDNAYINTHDTNLSVGNGYITNYAEMRNTDKIAVVDNDFRRLVNPANIQLYTQKTGSFALTLNGTINMKTTAPTVYNEPHMLVNGYHSAWNFVNRGFKENKDLINNTTMWANMDKNNYDEPSKRIAMRFDTTKDSEFRSDALIYDVSTTGALIRNDKKLKRGNKTTIKFKFDDVDIEVQAKVVSVEGNRAGVEFIDMPKEVANKILYKFMQRADSFKTNLKASSM